MDIQSSEDLLSAIRLLVAEDRCDGRFVFGRQELKPKAAMSLLESSTGGGDNSKNQLQTMLSRAGHQNPTYKTKQLRNNSFRAMVEFNGMQFIGQPCSSKKLAEKDAASEALEWLTGESTPSSGDTNPKSVLLKKSKKQRHRS